MTRQLTALFLGICLLAGCAEKAPPSRTVTEFVDNPLLLEAAVVRCAKNRAETRYDAECINAREAVNIVQAKEEALRRAELEERSERKREALRRTQQAAAEARQREAEQAMQAQIAEEQAQAAATHALSQYIPYIQQKIQRNWIRPAGSPPGMSCLILVKLIPGGEVVDARVVRSSGDALFDRSVETAVLKASPLPLPDDPAMFKYFREINFNFNPDN